MSSFIDKIWPAFGKKKNHTPPQNTPTPTPPTVEKTAHKRNGGVILTSRHGKSPYYAKSGRVANQRGAFGGV